MTSPSDVVGAAPIMEKTFEVRVIYLKISSFQVEESLCPDYLCFKCPRRDPNHDLEVNCNRIAHTEVVAVKLTRSRIDENSGEVTYIATDKIRTQSRIFFEIHNGNEHILSGLVKKSTYIPETSSSKGLEAVWSLECSASIASSKRCVFAKRTPANPLQVLIPSMEVFIVGHFNRLPAVLSHTTMLARSKASATRGTSLSAIPESDIGKCYSAGSVISEDDVVSDATRSPPVLGTRGLFHELENFLAEEHQEAEKEITWFNAGLRVGMGLGLGMCLGLGLGIGMLMNSYRVVSRPFKRTII